ncbi:hypothetical protein TARUN_8551 [Trichoderma arundinaceum]|uniref:Uncharacterized protein n=1 Tax=Trichoderma arundinaceum TaxID=490622 RepID=A0A395NC56_TRIAR|nr:hypothetical protein TARUN_8551 [Trichoderma arundinaceum]
MRHQPMTAASAQVASSADSQGEHGRPVTPSQQQQQQDSHEQTGADNFSFLPEALLAVPATPIAAPVAISGAAGNGPAIVEAITPSETVDASSSESPPSEASASEQHVILEPTVYVPPSRPSAAAEPEVNPVQPEGEARKSSSSSSSSSSGSGSGSNHEED